MSDIICCFRDHSDKKGILTYNKPPDFSKSKDDKEKQEMITKYDNGPQSIIKICKDHGIMQCYGVSRFMDSFFDAFKNLKKEGIQYHFGLELIMCDNAKEHSEDSPRNNHKVVIFYNGEQGYKDLIKIYSACHGDVNNFYYIARFDYMQLKKLWTNNLTLVIPFFDSFIHNNSLTMATIVPDMGFCTPVIFREKNSDLPFHSLIDHAIDIFNKDKIYNEQDIKTVCYYKPKDILQYQVYRCIENRSTMAKPEMEFFCSNKFNFMDYLDLKAK